MVRPLSIFLIAPGYPYDPQLVKKSQHKFESQGFRVIHPEGTLQRHFIFANKDECRLKLLMDAALDPNVDVIWAIRGGYGSNRLIPRLLACKNKLKKVKPKLLWGLSDVTSLHLYFNVVLGWPTVHGPVFEALGRQTFPVKRQKEIFRYLLQRKLDFTYSLKSLKGSILGHTLRLPIYGGNLAVLQGHIGTPLFPPRHPFLLFLEEVGERGYRIDRMLQHLMQSGSLTHCQGIIWGEVTGGGEPQGGNHTRRVIREFAIQTSLRVWKGVPSGHGKGWGSLLLGSSTCLRPQGGLDVLMSQELTF